MKYVEISPPTKHDMIRFPVLSQKSETRKFKSENSKPKSENRKLAGENRKPASENHKSKSEVFREWLIHLK